MKCKACGKPVHWVPAGTEDGGAWYHRTAADLMACPGIPIPPIPADTVAVDAEGTEWPREAWAGRVSASLAAVEAAAVEVIEGDGRAAIRRALAPALAEAQVIPVPPLVRTLGTVTDIDGLAVRVGVDYGTVSIAAAGREVRLDAAGALEFLRWFAAAYRAAGQQDI